MADFISNPLNRSKTRKNKFQIKTGNLYQKYFGFKLNVRGWKPNV